MPGPLLFYSQNEILAVIMITCTVRYGEPMDLFRKARDLHFHIGGVVQFAQQGKGPVLFLAVGREVIRSEEDAAEQGVDLRQSELLLP